MPGKSAVLDALIEEITTDAYGEDEQLWAFRQALEDHLVPPFESLVIGAPVTVLEIDYDGNQRLGLTARCRSKDGSKYLLALSSLQLMDGARGADYLAAYLKWMGVAPQPPAKVPRVLPSPGELMELAILSATSKSAICRILETNRTVTLRSAVPWQAVPGEIATVRPGDQKVYRGTLLISGEIQSTRLDVTALGLTPLALEQQGTWNPREHEWGEKVSRLDGWARAMVARGPRPEFEMEQILPGVAEDDLDSDPIIEAMEARASGDSRLALKILMDLCRYDLRCLDAHAHLGILAFDRSPAKAIRHYEAGFAIGSMSLGPKFKGLLPWGWIDNRPFLRCMSGFGLCLWRLKRFNEAEEIFERMLWLNPSDNQGARFCLADVQAKNQWVREM